MVRTLCYSAQWRWHQCQATRTPRQHSSIVWCEPWISVGFLANPTRHMTPSNRSPCHATRTTNSSVKGSSSKARPHKKYSQIIIQNRYEMPKISRNNSLEGADIWGSSEQDAGGGVDPCQSRNSSRPPSRSGSRISLSGQKRPAVQDEDMILGDEASHMTTGELRNLCQLLDNDIRIMRSDMNLISYQQAEQRKKIKES